MTLHERTHRVTLLGVLAAGCLMAGTVRAATTGPYRASADHRYLVDGQGAPFFVNGDSGWSSIVNLSETDALFYLDDCQQRGFNAVLVNVLEHKFTANAPANNAGAKPFSGVAFQSTPSAAYMDHVRWFVQRAAERGIVVFANPAYLGLNGGDEGWYQELNAAGTSAAKSWGTFVGGQLASSGNVVWHLFGDFDPPSHAQINAVHDGLLAAAPAYTLFAHHFARGVSSHEDRESWLSWNYLYPPPVGYMHVETLAGYNATPVIPQILGEGYYENDPQLPTTEDVRRQAWGTLTSGAAGHFYGNRHVWAFGNGFEPADWKSALKDSGRQQMSYVKAFFGARSWWQLQPDQASAWVVSGRGVVESAGYVTAALAADHSWGVAYLPGRAGPISVNRSKLAGTFDASWFNPRTGAYTRIASAPNTGTQQFTAPDQNDWVLLLERSPTAAAPAPAPAVPKFWQLALMPLGVCGAFCIWWARAQATRRANVAVKFS